MKKKYGNRGCGDKFWRWFAKTTWFAICRRNTVVWAQCRWGSFYFLLLIFDGSISGVWFDFKFEATKNFWTLAVGLHPGRGSCRPQFCKIYMGLQHHLQAASRAVFTQTQNTVRPKNPCETTFAVFRYCYYSCRYVRFWAPHCLSIRFVSHGYGVPQAASYGGGRSGKFGLVTSLACGFARVEHEGWKTNMWASDEVVATPLFRIMSEILVTHRLFARGKVGPNSFALESSWCTCYRTSPTWLDMWISVAH